MYREIFNYCAVTNYQMWSHRDISFRKIQRKWVSDGTKETVRASLETISRKLLWRTIYSKLSNTDTIKTVHRDELRRRARQFHICQLESKKSKDSLEEPFVAEIQSGYILTETGLGITEDGAYIVETASTPGSETNVMSCLSREMFSSDPRTILSFFRQDFESLQALSCPVEFAVPLIARHPNYYHWLIETVPKIRYISYFESVTDKKVTYLVPSDRPSWVKETLEQLGVPEKKVEWVKKPVYHAKPLLVPSFPHYSASDYQWLRKQVLDEDRTISEGSNIYISRSNAVSRQVVNEDEVMDLLSEYGFERYHLEHRSLEENAALFNEAEFVVGAHGAGLTDIVFCTNTSVVELFGTRVKHPYRQIAAELGLEYRELHCKPVSTDIYVDIAKLESIIMELAN